MKLLIFAVFVAIVNGLRYELKDDTGKVCILMDVTAKLTLTGQKDTETFIREINVPEGNVTGTCGDNETETSAVMRVGIENVGTWSLVFSRASQVQMTQMFTFTPALINGSLPSNETVDLSSDNLILSSMNSSFRCNAEQSIQFANSTVGGVTYSLTQEISNFQVQAFGVSNGEYSPAEECSQDVTTQPTTTVETTTTAGNTTEGTSEPVTTTQTPITTTAAPTANTYTVNGTNETCIVLKAIIKFSNFTYRLQDNSTRKVNDISIPSWNGSEAVNVKGSCGNDNSTTETMVITFFTNWTLELTFRKGTEAASLLTASNEYTLSDIQLTYYETSDVFPNALQPGQAQTAQASNLTDFLKGTEGGSYKCDAEVSQPLNNDVIFETTDLQYKAFNRDNSTTFSSDNVAECAADDESNSIVPIAVGAALAGLVIIVLIAYLIGRRRSRRQGYESV